eukprot:RCo034305
MGLDRLQSGPGAFTLFCVLVTLAGVFLIENALIPVLVLDNYPAALLLAVPLLNLAAYSLPQPLLSVVAVGLLMVILDAVVATVFMLPGNRVPRIGTGMALLGGLASFMGASPAFANLQDHESLERKLDSFTAGTLGLILVGEILLWISGNPIARPLWLGVAYAVSVVAGFANCRAFTVFAATALFPWMLIGCVGFGGLAQAGAACCTAALAGIVVHHVHRRYSTSSAVPLDREALKLENLIGSRFALARTLLVLCSLSGCAMVGYQAGDRFQPVWFAVVLLGATLLAYAAFSMHFGSLAVTAATLILSALDQAAWNARDAAEATDDLQLLGWLLLLLGSVGSLVAVLPFDLSDVPPLRNKHAAVTLGIAALLIAGCVAVWVDGRSDNDVLSLGFIGLVYLVCALYRYPDGVQFAFHAAIWMLGKYPPRQLLILPWLALVSVLVVYCTREDDYAPISGGQSGFWRPAAVEGV